MCTVIFANWLSGCDRLTRTCSHLLHKQCEWLRLQQELGMRVWAALTRSTASVESSTAQNSASTRSLEASALERLEKGLAPPREVYDVQNRGRIDWSRVPEWAQPADPESFEGCAHEG